MIKTLKSNKFIVLSLFIACILFILNPSRYANCCLNGLSIWSTKVFPTLFPFFILSRLIIKLSNYSSNPLDKLFNKIYNTPNGSLSIFTLSSLSGYPMGAKMIGTIFEDHSISKTDAKKLLALCNLSGPMFMIGTVGIACLGSYSAGIIICVSNILASLINGLIYKGGKTISNIRIQNKQDSNILTDTIHDSLQSILMVGGFIIFSFLLIEVLKSTNILTMLSNAICSVFNCGQYKDIVESILCGLIEITTGCINTGSINISLRVKTIITSSIIAFGGLSILFQSKTFIDKIGIPTRYILLQKTTQTIITFLVSLLLSLHL